MHINHDNLALNTESDVEQKIVMPLLSSPIFLGIAQKEIFTKVYLAPTELDKKAGKDGGYFPDYTIWMRGFPVLVVEAKAPGVLPETGYREASLYARHLNQVYPTDLNPSRFIVATDGKTLLFGYWDCNPVLSLDIGSLRQGSKDLERLQELCHERVLAAYASSCLQKVQTKNFVYPYNLAGGQALLHARRPLNSFAASLSPVLRRYFSSSNQEDSREIIERAYVSSAEITGYDRILEAFLKDRLAFRGDVVVEQLEPGRHGEKHVAQAISDFNVSRPQTGQLQIIQGAVGSGKSLFMRRYKEVLQSEELSSLTRWAFIDFNSSPPDLSQAERWLCKSFAEDFEKQNPKLDMSSEAVMRGVFCRNIQRRKTIYRDLERVSSEQAAIAKANDLAKWQDDPVETARGIADYILGSRQEILVVVMDNVDRLDLKNQLDAFQLALWFMQQTRCFVILQMRDETYERYKNQPPLDTFRTGIIFHIAAPRFIDVVKRRLELSLEYLSEHAQDKQTYTIETGVRITYPKSELGAFLHELYVELFDRKRNVSRVLEAIAGRDVRRALEMFVSIITSGYLSETAITSTVMGGKTVPITERSILKILMRTGYKFFSDNSGFISNIFSFNSDWQKPDNFLLVEILFFLATNRKRQGQIGLEGYFSCRYVADELQRQGYVPEDVLGGLNLLLKRQLVAADHMNFESVEFDDSVRILASGYMHVRILSGRLEYLYGVIPTTPILDRGVANQLADFVKNESLRGDTSHYQQVRAVEIFREYLLRQRKANTTPFSALERTGAEYVLGHIDDAIRHFKNINARPELSHDSLDF
jgi:hypothetical protein